MWMMMSSSSFPHRPSTDSLGQPEHLTDFGRCRTIDASAIDDFSCLIQTLHQNRSTSTIDPSTIDNLVWDTIKPDHRPIDHRQLPSAIENTLVDWTDP
jgi:hypothetical protein